MNDPEPMAEAAGRPAAGRVLRSQVVPVYWPIFITNAGEGIRARG